MTDFMKKLGRQMFAENGYPIIPISKGLKHPGKKYHGWQKTTPDKNKVIQWQRDPSVTGIGILTKTAPAIDIDVYVPEVVDKILSYMETEGLYDFESITRIGEQPKVLIPYRLADGEDPFKKVQSPVFVAPDGSENKVEILADGQQYVAYHIHPDTSEPYHYDDGVELKDVKLSELPELTFQQASDMVDWFNDFATNELEWTLKQSKRANSKFKTSAANSEDADIAILENYVEPLANVGDLKVVMTLEGIPSDLGYDDWSSVGMALWHQYSGGKTGYLLFKRWSMLSSKYKEGDVTRKKWDSFEPDYSAGKPITFAFALSLVDPDDKHKEQPSLRKHIAADDEPDEQQDDEDGQRRQGELILLRKATKKIDRFIARYVLVGHNQLIIDKEKPATYSAMAIQDFHKLYCNQLVEVLKPTKSDPLNTVWKEVSKLWETSTGRDSVIDFQYSPGKDRFFEDETGSAYANSFSYPDWRTIAENNDIDYEGDDRLDVFFEHMSYVYPNKDELKWMMQWVAFTIQQPHQRCPIAPIHVARTPGIGRSWILRAITGLMGPANVNTVDIEQIIGENGPFNDHLVDCKVIACEELYIGNTNDRYKVENTLKSDITDTRKQIRRKYGTQVVEQLYGNMMFLTNHSGAISIQQGERRYNVFSGPNEKRPPEYYEKLMDWLDEFKNGKAFVDSNMAQLFHYFENLDISDFNLSEPMDTPARRAMINVNKSDAEHLFDMMVENSSNPVMSSQDVHDHLSTQEGMTEELVDMRRVGGILRQRAVSLGRISVNGTQYRLWSLNGVNYTPSEAGEIYSEYLVHKYDDEFDEFDESDESDEPDEF